MGGDTDPVEEIAFLARSGSRVDVLEHLLESGPASQRDLREHLDTSRSTVTRSLQALEERDWIHRDGEQFHLTPIGLVIADEFLDLLETVRMTDELSAFLAYFPYAECELDLTQLSDGEVTAYTSSDPYAPARKHMAVLKRTSDFRGLLPSIDIESVRLTHDRILNEDLDSEMVVTPSVEATMENEEFAAMVREQLESGGLTVRVTGDDIPFYLGLAGEDLVQIGVEDDEGFPRALLETTNDSVRDWAETLYREIRADTCVKPVTEF